jgi:hypothetical protein
MHYRRFAHLDCCGKGPLPGQGTALSDVGTDCRDRLHDRLLRITAQVRSSVRFGSECCVATGDSGCEAYTAIAWGVGLSHERSDIVGAEFLFARRQHVRHAMRGADALPGSKAVSRAKIASEAGRSRVCPSVSNVHRVRWSASGRRGAVADDTRADPAIAAMKPANKVALRCGGVRGGACSAAARFRC